MPVKAPPDPSQFPEAASWFLGRLPMTRKQWDRLSARAQRKAFMVSGVAKADVIQTVFREIDRAIATGTSLGEFRKKVKDKLEEQWDGTVANPSWRIETIFRTNMQHAYTAGRVRQMREPSILAARPYWMLDVILDVSTSLTCEPLAGTILPAKHAWWKTHCPPLHFNCRTSIRCLTPEEAKKRGITKRPQEGEVAEGFGLDPDESEWKPDLKRFPPDLRKEVKARLASMPKIEPLPPPDGARLSKKRKTDESLED